MKIGNKKHEANEHRASEGVAVHRIVHIAVGGDIAAVVDSIGLAAVDMVVAVEDTAIVDVTHFRMAVV